MIKEATYHFMNNRAAVNNYGNIVAGDKVIKAHNNNTLPF